MVARRLLPLLLACSATAQGRDPSAPSAAAASVEPSVAPQQLAAASSSALTEYRWFHEHPEIANHERATAERLASALQVLGFEVQTGIGGTGVVATMSGQKAGGGRTILYRADMDALPVSEETGLPYASQTSGVMHACGHDLHMAIALGALRVMAETRRSWAGTLLFVGQPAEEIGAGARQVLGDPRFQSITARVGKPSLAVALHDASDLPAGQVAISSGYTTANVDSIDLVLNGKDGHGARPHEAVDPIVMAAEVILQLQTIISRRIPPDEPAVITVGKMQAGTGYNIIPASAELLITVRSHDDATRRTLLTEIQHVASSVAVSYHAPKPPLFTLRDEPTPSNLNDPAWSERLRRRFEAIVGKANVVPIPPSMGGDDFARFGRELRIPSVYWRLGAVPAAAYAQRKTKPLPSLHSASWAPDASAAMPIGIQTVVAALHEGLSAAR
jgi:hippurate hydrolase